MIEQIAYCPCGGPLVTVKEIQSGLCDWCAENATIEWDDYEEDEL